MARAKVPPDSDQLVSQKCILLYIYILSLAIMQDHVHVVLRSSIISSRELHDRKSVKEPSNPNNQSLLDPKDISAQIDPLANPC